LWLALSKAYALLAAAAAAAAVTSVSAYRTASGDTAPVHGLGAGDSSNAQQQLGTARPALAAAAGYHVALSEIQPRDMLTTNYLGLGHKRLMSTPARQHLLQSKFLFKCTCDR
jgi:hypothetical protein